MSKQHSKISTLSALLPPCKTFFGWFLAFVKPNRPKTKGMLGFFAHHPKRGMGKETQHPKRGMGKETLFGKIIE
ncbi:MULTISPECIES: hypothetical protein [Bacillus]|uniref:hypothetical protein n=1 Tax=Bacillus TaxID=1386 RepID=UPI00070FE289|nr:MULTISPECIES: hypothetical protein [Bacillus]MCP1181410.1 hypothetical protein [Bacillus sp. 1663tsa1]MDF9490837.1 hypothetical protein [Bacillus cereus]